MTRMTEFAIHLHVRKEEIVNKSLLEQMMSTTNAWMNLCLIVGAIGVFGDYALRFLFENNDRKNKIKTPASLLFAAMGLSGVVGGLIFGRRLSKESGLLQESAESRIALSDQKAERAGSEAAHSLEEARGAEERTLRNETEAARLRKVAEEEHLARVDLERQLAARRLPSNMQVKLAGKLLLYDGQRATVAYRAGDLESSLFAADIVRALIRAGWVPCGPFESPTIISFTGETLEVNRRQGVWLQYSPDKSSRDAGQALAKELLAIGFDVRIAIASAAQLGTTPMVFLTVEHRPQGPQGRPS